MLKLLVESIKQHIRKPIHFYSRPWILIGLNIVLSALIMIFYEPFGYHFDSWAEFTQLIGFSVIAFFSSVLFFLLIPQQPHVKNWMRHWTVGKNGLYSILFLLVTGLAISFYDFHLIMQYRSIDYGTDAFYVCLLTDTIGTITIGIVPLCVGLLLEHTHRLKQDLATLRKYHAQSTYERNKKDVTDIISMESTTLEDISNIAHDGRESEESKEKKKHTTIVLIGDTKESLEVAPQQILYLEASGNYVNVYYQQDKVARKILRTTFNKMEKQLTLFPFLVRCHRTYMVNIHFVKSIERNEQGYHVQLDDFSKEIPVSRTYLPDLRQAING